MDFQVTSRQRSEMRRDRRLIRRLRRGEPEALRRIYQEHKDDLLKIAWCFLGDLPSAEDALHDLFVGLAAGAASLAVKGSLKAYLSTAIANRARDALRERGRTRRRCPASLDLIEEVPSESLEPPSLAIAREEEEGVRKALLLLPAEQREVITLHLHGSMTFRQIASAQGASINTVQSRYRYGLDKLRSLILSGVGS
jgi:RNA polymerase sigma factor (sigma-70 family)